MDDELFFEFPPGFRIINPNYVPKNDRKRLEEINQYIQQLDKEDKEELDRLYKIFKI